MGRARAGGPTMYYKFNGFTQRLGGAAASAAYNPQVRGGGRRRPGALAAVTFAVLFLVRRYPLPGAAGGAGPAGPRSGRRRSPSRWRRQGSGRGPRGGGGELELPGELTLPGGGRLAVAVAVLASPAGPGLPGRGFGSRWPLFRWGGIYRGPVRTRRASSEPGLSGDLGRGEARRFVLRCTSRFSFGVRWMVEQGVNTLSSCRAATGAAGVLKSQPVPLSCQRVQKKLITERIKTLIREDTHL